jgi:hypothetical protein
MRNRVLVLSAFCFVMFGAVMVARLVSVQFATGSSFPALSSLRSDPLGTKVLYDTAEELGRNPERSYVPIESLRATNTTILVLGVSAESLVTYKVPSRNTVVLGLAGDCTRFDLKAWGVRVACMGKTASFEAPGWNVVEADTNGAARVISRRFGEAEVILLADSRMLNNGSLLRNRRTELIAFLLEQNPTIIFDEEHLGVTDAGSVGLLIRRYRLYGVVAALLLVFALFVWKNSSVFLPCEEPRTDEITGRDAGAGMANLLRRTIPPAELIPVAIAEWAKATGNQQGAAELSRVALPHKNPVDAYRAISRALSQRRQH